VCSASGGEGVTLVVLGKPRIMSGKRDVEVYDCAGAETGEHRIVHLE
jgi:hypothetical protein